MGLVLWMRGGGGSGSGARCWGARASSVYTGNWGCGPEDPRGGAGWPAAPVAASWPSRSLSFFFGGVVAGAGRPCLPAGSFIPSLFIFSSFSSPSFSFGGGREQILISSGVVARSLAPFLFFGCLVGCGGSVCFGERGVSWCLALKVPGRGVVLQGALVSLVMFLVVRRASSGGLAGVRGWARAVGGGGLAVYGGAGGGGGGGGRRVARVGVGGGGGWVWGVAWLGCVFWGRGGGGGGWAGEGGRAGGGAGGRGWQAGWGGRHQKSLLRTLMKVIGRI